MATADQPVRWRRYVILHHRLPPHQSLPSTTSPRELPSPAGGAGARDAERQGCLEPTRNLARGSHYDVMFETAAGLLTWAVEQMPAVEQPPQPALRLPLHRAAYLDYEGPISGDRGEVLRVQAGTYRPASLGECAASRPTQHDPAKIELGSNDLAADQHYAFVCRGRDADGQTVAQLVLLERVEAGGWALRSIIAPPR